MKSSIIKSLNKLVLEGQINPANLTFLSKILNRQITPEKKDTRDYCNYLISRLDTGTLNMMEAGLRDTVYPGEGVLLTAYLKKSMDNDSEIADYIQEAVEKKGLTKIGVMKDPVIPFSYPTAFDIGSKHFLRTSASDTFESIFKEIDINRSKFINDADWSMVVSAIKNAEVRIKAEPICFLQPINEGIIGEHRQLTDDEKIKWGFDVIEEMDADFRNDSHDLISLKALAYAMESKELDTLSPFAGAFNKYMPELNKLGVRGIVFEVVDNVLKSIRLSLFNGKDAIPYGPSEASIALMQTHPELKARTDFKTNTQYYVSVSGFICAPEDISDFGYLTLLPKLTNIVPAAETVLFQLLGDVVFSGLCTPAMTRLYFYPYKPSELHPMLQKMTNVYGNSDNMYHSCAYDPKHVFYDKAYAKQELDDAGSCLFYHQPAARYVYDTFSIEHPYFSPAAIFSDHPENIKQFGSMGEDVSNSIYGENYRTNHKYIEYARKLPNYPNTEADRAYLFNLEGIILPLPSAFIFYKYTQNDRGGINTREVATTWRHLPEYNFSGMNARMAKELEVGAGLSQAMTEVRNGGDLLSSINKFLSKIKKTG